MKTNNNLKSDEPPLSISPFETLISNVYIDHIEIIVTIRKYSFETTLYPILTKVDEYITSGRFDALPLIVGTLLTTINDKLALISGKEKSILEELASELFKEQISVLNSTEEGRSCWQKCLPIIEETCDFKGYDFLSLSQLVGFNLVKKSKSDNVKSKVDLPYYVWLGKSEHLIELIRDIKDKQWISNVNEFKKLFKPISEPNYTFSAKSEYKEKLLVLFAELKNYSLIRPKTNRGHFYPLTRYGVDFEKRLFEKEPKRYMENLKRKQVEYTCAVAEVQKMIRINCEINVDL